MFAQISKIILISMLAGFVLASVVLPACEFVAHPEYEHVNYQHSAQHCPMEQLGQVAANLQYLQQLNKALPGVSLKWQYTLSVVVFSLLASVLLSIANTLLRLFLYFQKTIIRHMKPWDYLRIALAQGLIHSKHLG